MMPISLRISTLKEYRGAVRRLVGFDAHPFDDRPPFVQLRFQKRGQLGCCRASGNRANVRKSLLRLRMGNRSYSIDVYLSDNLSRGLGR